MDYYYADLTCFLKVDMNCWACKDKVREVLQSIRGVNSITIDAERGIVRVAAKVDPNILLRVLANSGTHAKILWVQLENENATTIDSQWYNRDQPTIESQWYNRDQLSLPAPNYYSQPSLTAANHHSPVQFSSAPSYYQQAPQQMAVSTMHYDNDTDCCRVM